MPIYELHCQKCDSTFEMQQSIAVYEQHKKNHDLECPDCRSTDLETNLGAVEVKTSKKS